MKPKVGRELALLTLPILIIGGLALWSGKVKSWSGFGAPRGLYEGKPRLEITDWKREMPSALDFARGISSRWTVTMWNGGACPTGAPRPRYAEMNTPHALFLAWKQRGRWQQQPIRYSQIAIDAASFRGKGKPTSATIGLGLPLDLVPRDAEEVRLRGRFNGWTVCQSGIIKSPSAPIDKVIKAPQEKWPQSGGSQVSPLKFQRTNQFWAPFALSKHPKALDLTVEGHFTYSGESAKPGLFIASAWIVDGKGKETGEMPVPGGYSTDVVNKHTSWHLNTRKLNPMNGPFTLKSWVYVDKSEWPLQVSIPLQLAPAAKNQARPTKAIR
ncbi:hypothetical protein B1R32_10673 [Abditibacterium utsteinense]|uniref:Uncharacterized protein n=1 Tax=Abditibacterium utsteinense TaxID=1960156 RepID=A0A2S8STX4_9BACT|nr:hypothetical protein [Abditibacterium utsteinense]PQV64228.1 hypothetical protein B1R32_10673 [Abditibacterium utsteinense]